MKKSQRNKHIDRSETFDEFIAKEGKAAREAWAARNPDHDSQSDVFNVGPGHHMPDRCQECGAIGSLRSIEINPEGMSEGQEADHDQGLSGFAFCRACKSNVFWQA